MIRGYAIIRESARHIAEAANSTVEALRDGRIEQEPAYTDRMLGRIEQAMEKFNVNGVKWTAKTLTDRGRKAQESKYGADFMGVLDISLPGYAVQKGFLAQGKMIRPKQSPSESEWRRMQGQCRQMLDLSPHSFLFVYSLHGTRVVPAASILSVTGPINLHELYSRSITKFFEDHFESFIGDRRISTPHIDTLKALRIQWQARSLLYLRASLAETIRNEQIQ